MVRNTVDELLKVGTNNINLQRVQHIEPPKPPLPINNPITENPKNTSIQKSNKTTNVSKNQSNHNNDDNKETENEQDGILNLSGFARDENKDNNDNNNITETRTKSKSITKKKTRDKNKKEATISISNMTSVPTTIIDNVPFTDVVRYINGLDDRQKVNEYLQCGLNAISESFQESIKDLNSELKLESRTIQNAIKSIDEQMYALSQHKKYLNTQLRDFSQQVDTKIDKLSAHQIFIEKLSEKHKIAILNNFIPDKPKTYPDPPVGMIQCQYCGHNTNDKEAMNIHLIIHENDQRSWMNESQWKQCLTQIISHYSAPIKKFQEKVVENLMKQQKPVLPPSRPVDPHRIYGIPSDPYTQGAHTHNKSVLANYRNNVNDMNNMNRNNIINGNNKNHNHNGYTNITVPGLERENNNGMMRPQLNQSQTNAQILASLSNKLQTKSIPQLQPPPSKQPVINTLGNNNNNHINHNNNNNSVYSSDGSESQPIITKPIITKQRKIRKHKTTAIAKINGNPPPIIASVANKQIGFRKTNKGYPSSMGLDDVMHLVRGTHIDYRDFNGRWLKAQIVQIDIDKVSYAKKYGITYVDWDDCWNVWSVPKHQFQRYALYESISQRGLNRNEMKYIKLKKPYGDYLEVKPMHMYFHSLYKMNYAPDKDQKKKIDTNFCNQYLQWHVAQVMLSDRYSAQVQVILFKYDEQDQKWYKKQPKADCYWVHLDNRNECAPRNTHIINPQFKIVKPTTTSKKRKNIPNGHDTDNKQDTEPNPPTKKQKINTKMT